MDRFILLQTPDSFGMGGAQCTELICSVLKNGTISLRTCVDQYSDGGRSYDKAIRGIKHPSQFITAVNQMDEIVSHFSIAEVLASLYPKLPLFSSLTGIYARFEDDDSDRKFFNLVFPRIENLSIKMPSSYQKGQPWLDVIYHYVKVWFDEHGDFPSGEHKILEQTVNFLSQHPRSHQQP